MASMSAKNRFASIDGAFLNALTIAIREVDFRRRTGVISATGTPLRVTTKDSPPSNARIIAPLSFRSSRWVISRCTKLTVAHVPRRVKNGVAKYARSPDSAVTPSRGPREGELPQFELERRLPLKRSNLPDARCRHPQSDRNRACRC